MDRNAIQFRKEIGLLLKQSKKEGKRLCCALCGEKRSSFCNSHSIPSFVIRNIVSAGCVLLPSVLTLNNLASDEKADNCFDAEKGVNNSWTFHSICSSCDKKYFADYESPEVLHQPLTNKMMAEIALKNALIQLDKRASEIPLYNIMQERNNTFINKEDLDTMLALDVKDWEFDKKRAKKIIDKNLKSGYRPLYWRKLPYTVPYALQAGITLVKDMRGHQINAIYNFSPDLRMQFLQMVVFPLKGTSVVSAFFHKDDRNYYAFARDFDRLLESEKLDLINFWAIKYSENLCATPILSSVIENNVSLLRLFSECSESPYWGVCSPEEKMSYAPVKKEEVPNLLSEAYSLEKLRGVP